MWADHTLLFVDDHDIFFRAGTRRVLEKPVRHAKNPIIAEARAWEMAIDWQRPFRDDLWLKRSPDEQFDSGCVLTNPDVIIANSEMRFYYGAYSSGAIGGGTNITGDQQKSGVGLVTLPLDRFAGLHSMPDAPTAKLKNPADIGQITLKPVDPTTRTEICINANALGGAVWCEILDEQGFRIPGFEKENCIPLENKDSTRHRFAWREKNPGDLKPGKHLIRLHLESAIAYSVELR